MSKVAATASTTGHRAVIGLDNMEAHRDINHIAKGVVDRSMSTDEMVQECAKLADKHYVTIVEVYKKIWAKVEESPDLHPTHPAGKSQAYHKLRELATR